MEVVRFGAEVSFEGEAGNVVGVDGGDVVDVLEATVDFEERFLDDDETVPLKCGRGDEGVGDAGFIFEAEEEVAVSAAGALATDDESGDDDGLAVAALSKITGAPDADGLTLCAYIGHGMRTGCEAETGVVGIEALDGRHGSEFGEGGSYTSKQVILFEVLFALPKGVSAVLG